MTKYYWKCNQTNDKGCFHADFENCNARGKAVFKTAWEAAKAGLKHNDKHKWCGWGYAPMGWKNTSTVVMEQKANGKAEYIGDCHRLA